MNARESAPTGPNAWPAFNPSRVTVGLIVCPMSAKHAIALARLWPVALLLASIIQVVTSLAGLTAPTLVALLPPVLRNPVAMVVGSLIIDPAILLIEAGALSLIGQMLGGRGLFSTLLSTLAYGWLPALLLASVSILINLAAPPMAALNGVLNNGMPTRILVLNAIGIQEGLGLTTERSAITCLIAAGASAVIACVLLARIAGAVQHETLARATVPRIWESCVARWAVLVTGHGDCGRKTA